MTIGDAGTISETPFLDGEFWLGCRGVSHFLATVRPVEERVKAWQVSKSSLLLSWWPQVAVRCGIQVVAVLMPAQEAVWSVFREW